MHSEVAIIHSCSCKIKKPTSSEKDPPHSTCLVDGGSLHHFTKQILSQTFLGPLAKPLRLLQLLVLLLHTLHTLNLPGFGAAK